MTSEQACGRQKLLAQVRQLNRETRLEVVQILGLSLALVVGIGTLAISLWELAIRAAPCVARYSARQNRTRRRS